MTEVSLQFITVLTRWNAIEANRRVLNQGPRGTEWQDVHEMQLAVRHDIKIHQRDARRIKDGLSRRDKPAEKSLTEHPRARLGNCAGPGWPARAHGIEQMGRRQVSGRRLDSHPGTVLAHFADLRTEQETAIRSSIQARQNILIKTICRQVAVRRQQRRLPMGRGT